MRHVGCGGQHAAAEPFAAAGREDRPLRVLELPLCYQTLPTRYRRGLGVIQPAPSNHYSVDVRLT